MRLVPRIILATLAVAAAMFCAELSGFFLVMPIASGLAEVEPPPGWSLDLVLPALGYLPHLMMTVVGGLVAWHLGRRLRLGALSVAPALVAVIIVSLPQFSRIARAGQLGGLLSDPAGLVFALSWVVIVVCGWLGGQAQRSAPLAAPDGAAG